MRTVRRWAVRVGVVTATVAAAACGAGDGAGGSSGEAEGTGNALSPVEAREAALEMYLARQEYIEMYYGAGGRYEAGEAVAAAVDRSEERFHELTQLLMASPAAEAERVRAAAEAVVAAHGEVVERVREAGVPLTPPTEDPIQGTPPGGLEDWVADVREMLDSVAQRYSPEAGAAQAVEGGRS